MFCLSEQIRCNPGWIAGFISNDRHFAWSRDHVDIDYSIDVALRRLNIWVARPDNLVDLWDGLGSIGKRSDRLRSADPVSFVQVEQLQSSRDQRILFQGPWRCDGNNTLDTCNLSRDDIHQHGRGISCLATGNVNAGSLNRRLADPQSDTIARVILPGVFDLLVVELANIFRGLLQNFDQFVIGIGGVTMNVFFVNAHRLRRQIELIEAFCVIAQRFVAAAAYILDNFMHRVLDVLLEVIRREKTVDLVEIQFRTQVHDPHRITFSSA